MCVCVCVCIQASFAKDDGTLFIIFSFFFFKTPFYFSSVMIYMVKELSHIFCPSAFYHTFGCHQG